MEEIKYWILSFGQHVEAGEIVKIREELREREDLRPKTACPACTIGTEGVERATENVANNHKTTDVCL